jgi:hypothetical protein
MDTLERRVWGERRPKDMAALQIIVVFTVTRPKTSTWGCVRVCDKYLHWPRVSVKNIYTMRQDKCKSFTLTLDLHAVYMAIDIYTHNTDTNVGTNMFIIIKLIKILLYKGCNELVVDLVFQKGGQEFNSLYLQLICHMPKMFGSLG